MKKIKYLFSSLILLSLLVSVISCENTNENLVKERGVAVVPGISNLEPAFYTTDFENTFIEFDVDLPEGETVDEAELYATFNGKTALIQPITSFPITITLKLQDVMTKLGLTENDVDVVDNNLFDFNIRTTSGGITTTSKAGAMRIFVTCEFAPAMAVGSYNFVTNDWDAEGDVTFTADPNDPYKIFVTGIYAAEGGEPNDLAMELNISPTSFEVSGPKSRLGDKAPWGSYTNYYYQPTSGLFKSCTGTFEMKIAITVDQGSFGGPWTFVFTRNE
jgi:hypothetical protein